jgi:hypothetical protein
VQISTDLVHFYSWVLRNDPAAAARRVEKNAVESTNDLSIENEAFVQGESGLRI